MREPQALSDLHRVYKRIVHVVILRIVRSPEAAEDLVQDTSSAFGCAPGVAQTIAWGPGCYRLRGVALYIKSPQSRGEAIDRNEGWNPATSIEADLLTVERFDVLGRPCSHLQQISAS